MNADIRYLKGVLDQLGQAVTVYRAERNKITSSAHARQEQVEAERLSEEARVNAAMSALTREYASEAERRAAIMERALISVNDELNNINEPHWHRMKHEYYEKARQDKAKDHSGRQPEALLAELETLLQRFYRETQKLRGAFISPGMANAIGCVFRPYRGETYRSLAALREKILRCAEAIHHLTDIDEKGAFAESVKRDKLNELNRRAAAHLGAIPAETQSQLENLETAFAGVLEQLQRDGAFALREIKIGSLEICGLDQSVINRLPAGFIDCVTDSGLSIPLSVSRINSNILLVSDGERRLSTALSSLALDILKQDPAANISVSDIEGMGSNYPALSRPSERGNVQIWRTEEELIRGLEHICCAISETYAAVLGDSYEDLQEYNHENPGSARAYRYVFIENISANITDRSCEMLRRIVNNGARAGVYVVMSVNKDAVLSRQAQELLQAIVEHSELFTVNGNAVAVTDNMKVLLPEEIGRDQVNAACRSIDSLHSAKAVIPLGPRLPAPRDWQKKSSADGIEISIGVDRSGHESTLVLSEDRPYAMIIGDVDAGKSSLLHAIVIQTMANYADSEVKIAIGDFKDGAEFNIYGASKLRPIEAVVDNEDPDVMASFLRYFIQEMHCRQQLFEQLESCTNRLVRKYETYRSVWSESGFPTPEMPRLLLIIDEFQSLFENVSGTAALLSELVRKGRTYGIHIVMASQRAASDNPRNSFSGDLKNYFTSRFVFKAPQAAARTMLSERCADTGRENTGIARASLLLKGHALYNTYMGQTEKDNSEIQCFYANDGLVTGICEAIARMNGRGESILLRKNDTSVRAPESNDHELILGMSPCLRRDYAEESADDIHDDIRISISLNTHSRNMICSGPDDRVAASAALSALRQAAAGNAPYEVHVFGKEANALVRMLASALPGAQLHQNSGDMKNELSRQASSAARCINVFAELPDFSEYAQPSSGLRVSPESELLKQIVNSAERTGSVNIIHAKHFRSIRSAFPYMISAAPICLLAVGDTDNIRNATADRCRFVSSDFDVPRKDAIKAYYYNKDTEKFGKIILFRIESSWRFGETARIKN